MWKLRTFLCAEKVFTVVRVHHACHPEMVRTRLLPRVSWLQKWIAAPVKLFLHPTNALRLVLI